MYTRSIKCFRKASCLVVLLTGFACERNKANDQDNPDAVRDLLIDRIFWKPVPMANRPGVLLNQHQFSLTNTSSQHSYQHIQVRFDYYDSQYHRIGSRKAIIDQFIEPRSAVAIPPVQAGEVYPLTKSATVVIEEAVAP